MFMKTKKIISILLAVLMLTSLASISVFAKEQPIASVREFINAPSQYTNNAAYGIDIDGTLNGKLASLGNFGGYVIYEFNKPVQNTDKHAYGVDFIIPGNAFNAALTTQEPGQVWVSQNGKDWYALAGSEHYEDETVWDYSVTYKKTAEANKCDFSDSLGESGTWGCRAQYPLSENYPTVTVPEDEITLSGVLLRKQTSGSTSNGIQTSFGYTDALKNAKKSAPSNPYVENPAGNGIDGQFDISWAVDKNGFGVELDSIKYVKVQTATFINGGAFGEKSTELQGLFVADESEESVGKTAAPASITVGGKKIELEDGKDYYEAAVDGEFDVSVEADANIYINNSYGNTRHFESETEKGIVRVIVQSGNSAPVIYYINTGKSIAKTKITLSDTEKEIGLGKKSKLTAETNNGEKIAWSSSDESVASVSKSGIVTANKLGEADIIATSESGRSEKCKVTVIEPVSPVTVNVTYSVSGNEIPVQKHSISVSSDIAEKYGYETAEKDHNDIDVEGVTVFDVIVAAHEELYGESFKKNPENYLVMSSSFIMKAYGQNAMSSGFIVNGIMPNDGIINLSYGTCTGYACDTARVFDGDEISYFFYKDLKYYSDYYAWFDCDSYNVNAGEELTVSLNGYCAMYYGINDWQTILDEYAQPLEGIQIYAVIDGEKILVGTTDKNGKAVLSFAEEGKYVIFCEGETKDKCPVITNSANVTVNPQQTHKRTFCEWLKHIWEVIKNFFIKAHNFLFGWIYKG